MNKKLLLVIASIGTSGLVIADAKKPTHVSQLEGKTTITIKGMDSFSAMSDSIEGLKVREGLEKKRIEVGQDITKKSELLRQDAQKFNEQKSVMSEKARVEKENELLNRERELKNMAVAEEENLKREMGRVTGKLTQSVQEAAEKIAKREKIDIIVDRATGGIVYMDPKLDLTQKIMTEMDRDYSVKLASADKQNSKSTKA